MERLKKLTIVLMTTMTLCGLYLLSKEIYNLLILPQKSEAERVYFLWKKDLTLLEHEKKLPGAWKNIKEVQLIGGTPITKEWLQRIESPVALNTRGDHRLEVLLLDWTEGNQRGFVVQYTLIDLKNGNLIWQLGRTFALGSKPLGLVSDLSKPSVKPVASPAAPN